MLDSAREALVFAAGCQRSDLDDNRLLVLGLVKAIEIIGEAASKVSTSTRELAPSIPWAQVIGMRNHLVHVYFDVDVDRVWDTIVDDLPPLIAALEVVVYPGDSNG